MYQIPIISEYTKLVVFNTVVVLVLIQNFLNSLFALIVWFNGKKNFPERKKNRHELIGVGILKF